MNKIILCFALAAFPCLAQTKATTAGKRASTGNNQGFLKDDFAKSSLRVLRKIEGETGAFQLSPSGGLLVPHATHEALDNLDIEAQSKSEQMVSGVLLTFFNARLAHNNSIAAVSSMVFLAISESDSYRDSAPERIAAITSKSPAVREMKIKELACSTEIETLLRNRKFHSIAACTETALTVVTPKTLDVSVQ